ncbi:Protein of unknown function [Lactobacillus delbrueckii subsp. lactis]|nr:Putative uncharacterized protein [Lactobacillus delbrueckii subsp. lactis]CDR80591.1 Protein of unknown function [Lactobacillus delbrueckii subsp. lactis]
MVSSHLRSHLANE